MNNRILLNYIMQTSKGSGKNFPPDWTEIGYENTPQDIIDAFNYAKEIKENWNSNTTSLENKFMSDKKLFIFPNIDTSNVTIMTQAFAYSSLISLPLINTSNVTAFTSCFRECLFTNFPLIDLSNSQSCSLMFANCRNLIEIPKFTFSKNVRYATDSMFSGCTSLKNVPFMDLENVSNIRNMFSNCSSLTNESLNNIMGMCISATKITSNKTLKYIGLSQEQATTCQTLLNYQAFLDAGWTTGY